MADQGRWFKLWCISLNDQELENLSLENWARWVRLGVYIKEHGVCGKVRFRAPGTALVTLMRVTDFNAALEAVKMFPNCALTFRNGERESTVTTVTPSTVTAEIEYKNWLKYQGDFSNDRVRKFRDKKRHRVTAQEERRSRGEVEEKRLTPIAPGGAKQYPLPDPKTNPKACLVLSYKSRKGVPFDSRDWDKTSWGRAMVSAGSLLGLAGDLPTAEACLNDLSAEYEAKGLAWTLETVARNAADWLKKTGRTNADTSRAGLRMAIAQRRTEGKGAGGVAGATERAVSAPVRDVTPSESGVKKDGDH